MATKKAKKANRPAAKKMGKKQLSGVTTLSKLFPVDPCKPV
jgi:hypothetical protein